MLSVKTSPRTKPATVPTMPMLAPLSMKMRRIMPREAPIVRRIAMSRPLSFTIMIMLEMMLNAATTMINVRIRNITLRSISTALNRLELACCQSTIRTRPASAAVISRRCSRTRSGSATKTSRLETACGQAEEQLRRVERRVDEAVVVFVHADIEQRHDMVGLDPRHRAESRRGPLRRNQRDRAADGDPEPARQPIADGDAVVAEIGERALDDVVREQWQ